MTQPLPHFANGYEALSFGTMRSIIDCEKHAATVRTIASAADATVDPARGREA